jgi:DNA-binding transcriptional LysR family regulator
VLRACRRSHSGIALELSESNAAEMTEAVASSRLHCGLLRVPVAQPESLVFEALLQEPVVMALPSDHPLAASTAPLSLGELQNESFILVRRPGAPGLYANLLALCRAQGFEPRIATEVDRMMSNLNLVAAGVGISVVPASMQGVHAHAITYRALLKSEPLNAPLTLVYRRADCVGPTRDFVLLARKIAAKRKKV